MPVIRIQGEQRMEKRELTCIGCPMGCQVTVTMDKGAVTEVHGNTCQKGDVYARKEVVDPTRIVTSTIRILGGDKARVSVKTAEDIPKNRIFDVMREIDRACVYAPVQIGDVLIEDAAGCGVNVIATREIAKI